MDPIMNNTMEKSASVEYNYCHYRINLTTQNGDLKTP